MDACCLSLERPFAFDSDRIAFSFRHGWVEVVAQPAVEDLVAEHVDEWLDALAADGNIDRLRALAERMADVLRRLDGKAADSNDTPEEAHRFALPLDAINKAAARKDRSATSTRTRCI